MEVAYMNIILNNVLKTMKDSLNSEQMKLLEETLLKEFKMQYSENKISNNKLLDDFISSKVYENCSEQTIAQYKRENERFLVHINKRVEDIDKRDIERYLAEYREYHGISNVTLNNMRRFISAFFNYLEFEDIIKCNPVRKTKPVRELKAVKSYFSELEVEKMRETAMNNRDKAIIEVLNTTGVRVSELCNMNILDIQQGTAVIRGKGNKERHVYFSDKALYYVNKYLGSRKDNNEALFINYNKTDGLYKRMTKNSVEKIIKDLGLKINIKAYPHKFRRTVATRGINKGMPIQEVQALLGHSKIETTMIYCNVDVNNIQMSHKKYIA